MTTPPDFSLYLALGPDDCRGRDPALLAECAARAGVSCVQLRDKNGTTRRQIALARALRQVLGPRGVPLIVNDRVDVALAAAADGVHLGQDDMDLPAARALAGEGKILGLSVSSRQEVSAAPWAIADYAGFGACFATPTKPDAQIAGLSALSAARAQIDIPLIAIGGINEDNAARAIAAGADGVCVISAICAADDPARAARSLRRAVDGALHARHSGPINGDMKAGR